MPFCTMLEWEKDFDFSVYETLTERAGGRDRLPEGCMSRIVGAVETGARVIEVWESPDHARKFGEAHSPAIAELKIPPPDRVAAFETKIYLAK